MLRKTLLPIPFAAMLALAACGNNNVSSSGASSTAAAVSTQDAATTATPIKHVVVIFGENESFDHYYGTYPNAQNPDGEPVFTAAAGTPTVNGLTTALLTSNPTVSNTANGTSAINPFRLDRTQASTESQNHSYTPEQLAADNGKMDAYPANTGNPSTGTATEFGKAGLVMGYYDGNTVTAMWNYAQHFAMSDNAYTDTYGPSTPGAISVVSGQHNGAVVTSNGAVVAGSATTSPSTDVVYDLQGGWTLIGDLDPTGDVCTIKAGSTTTAAMTSKNIGDLLNSANLTWGGFMGGFDLTATNANGTTGCSRSTYSSVLGASENDYVQHHAWFQYYTSTQNLAHTRPTSTAEIGYTDPLDNTATPVHHQYDVNDFFTAVKAGNFPSVSFLKAPAVADAHPGNSDPLDEQAFVTSVVNFLQQQPDWKNTAVIVTYDDSDGWYDHQYASPTTSSFDSTSAMSTGDGTFVKAVTGADQLNGAGVCNASGAVQGVGINGGSVNGRCGPGTRIPFVVISPYAKANYVDSTDLITQSSVVRFIEDNWLSGQRIGQGSNDANAGSIMNMFDFTKTTPNAALYLDSNLGTALTTTPAAITTPSL